MDKEKIIGKINQQITDAFGSLIIPEVIEDLSEHIYNNIRKDICPKDLINYHDVVQVVEDLRPDPLDSNKTKQAKDAIEKTLNKIRDAIRNLKRS